MLFIFSKIGLIFLWVNFFTKLLYCFYKPSHLKHLVIESTLSFKVLCLQVLQYIPSSLVDLCLYVQFDLMNFNMTLMFEKVFEFFLPMSCIYNEHRIYKNSIKKIQMKYRIYEIR